MHWWQVLKLLSPLCILGQDSYITLSLALEWGCCPYNVGISPGGLWAQVQDMLSGRLVAISGTGAEDLLAGFYMEASGTVGTSSASISATLGSP